MRLLIYLLRMLNEIRPVLSEVEGIFFSENFTP